MRKGILILVAAGITLLLSGCGRWSCWGDHNHHASYNHYSSSHYQGYGHSEY